MALTTGTKLGPYEVTATLGSGGMGEVYRASDTKLKRQVALKVLPELFAGDAQRAARFEREAQLLASLNHSHIAHLHGLEEANGIRALVMELVEGPTLAERIAQGPIPLEDALPLAKQIAEALEYAHDRGIIHRDLKPTNIKLTPDGQVKVLDFGLAKALEGDVVEASISTSPTISAAATRAGMLLGTAGYMSPEQAKGKPVDRRTDIWAFGCVLYEMLSGKPAFSGETVTDTLAGVVRGEPEWSLLPENTPGRIRELLHRCLLKDQKQRLQAVGEARIAIEKYLADPHAELAAVEGQKKNHERLLSIIAATAALAAILLGVLYWRKAPEEPRVTRSYIKPMPNSSLVLAGQTGAGFALSPDGRRLAYAGSMPDGKTLLWVRPIDSLQAQPLAGTEGGGFPFWSPDSRFIGFFAGGKLKKIEALGGPPLTLCDAPLGRGATWNQEGVILFTPGPSSPIYRVSAAGGETAQVTTLKEQSHRWPYFLPDGRHFLYLAGSPFTPKESPANAVMIGSLDSKEGKLLFHNHSNAIFASGHILFLRQNTLMAQPFDAKRLELTGDAFPIADPVQEDEGRILGVFSASSNGIVTFAEGTRGLDRQLIWVDRTGKKVGEVPGADAYGDQLISPDGKRVLFSLGSSGSDIWVYDIARGVKTRLTFGSSSSQANQACIWSPDGSRIAYTGVRPGTFFGLFQRPSDGSGNEEVILEGTSAPKYPNDWSPDGKVITYYESHMGVWEIWMIPLTGERKPYPFLKSQFNQLGARFSPDGKWVAYSSVESGRPEVYVVPFPGPGGKWQVSTGGGTWPRWRRDGKEIFYLSPDNKIMAAEVKASGPSFEVSAIRPIFETRPYRAGGAAFDVTPDGQRFIINYLEEQPSAAITLVINWPADLKR